MSDPLSELGLTPRPIPSYTVGEVYEDQRDGTRWRVLDKRIEVGDIVIFKPNFTRFVMEHVTPISVSGYPFEVVRDIYGGNPKHFHNDGGWVRGPLDLYLPVERVT